MHHHSVVMPGYMPGIHVLMVSHESQTWMAGPSPAMTVSVSHARLTIFMPGFVAAFTSSSRPARRPHERSDMRDWPRISLSHIRATTVVSTELLVGSTP
jgi:hypothetical protein